MIQDKSTNRNAFLASYIKTISFIKGIIISDREGIQLNFALADPETEGKYWPISSMLIAALNQTNDNINKIAKGQKIGSLTLCFEGYLIHLFNMKNLIITILFSNDVSLPFAKEIARDIASVMQRLDDQEPQIRQNL